MACARLTVSAYAGIEHPDRRRKAISTRLAAEGDDRYSRAAPVCGVLEQYAVALTGLARMCEVAVVCVRGSERDLFVAGEAADKLVCGICGRGGRLSRWRRYFLTLESSEECICSCSMGDIAVGTVLCCAM